MWLECGLEWIDQIKLKCNVLTIINATRLRLGHACCSFSSKRADFLCRFQLLNKQTKAGEEILHMILVPGTR